MKRVDDTKWWHKTLLKMEAKDNLPKFTLNRQEMIYFIDEETNRFYTGFIPLELTEIKAGCGFIEDIIIRVSQLKAKRRITTTRIYCPIGPYTSTKAKVVISAPSNG